MASKATESELLGTSVGRFVIRERLAAGGMGEVYRAEDTLLRRTVALKRILPGRHDDAKSRRRMSREARCASQLNHPNIAAVYDVLDSPVGFLLVMEYVEGETLRKRMRRPFSADEFLALARQCASALQAAHAAGVVHRDIKPENIMLTSVGQVKILDFGIAREPLAAEFKTTLENMSSENLAGTIDYMAPEVIERGAADLRSDLFSLGVVFYEILAGHRPFCGKTFYELCEKILSFDPPPIAPMPGDMPPHLGPLVARLLAKHPAQRYPSAAELLHDLEAHEAAPVRESPHPRPFRLPARFQRPFLVGATVLLLAVGAVFIVPAVRNRSPNRATAVTLPRSKQVAVLPFTAVNADPADVAFGEGLADTVTAKLTELTTNRSLQVVPAGEIQSNGIRTVSQARKKFGVTLVVEGNLTRSGDLLRVNYTVVDAQTTRQLRARSITLASADSFAIQDQVVEGVAKSLDLSVSASQTRLLEKHGTEVPGAHDFYLQGRGYLSDYDKPANIDRAMTAFQRALDLDPKYALAYTGIGQAYWAKYRSTNDARWIEPSRSACEQALAFNAALAPAHICIGWVDASVGNDKAAAVEFERALEREPTSDAAYRGLANAYQALGDFADAEKTYQRAIALRPQYWAGYNWLGAFYYNQARYTEAAKMFERVISLSPDNAWGYSNLGTLDVYRGRYNQAISLLQHSLAIEASAAGYSDLGNAYFYLRQFPQATEAYEKAASLAGHGFLGYTAWWNLGDGYHFTAGRAADAARAYHQALLIAADALKLNPRDADAMGVSAICKAMLNEKSGAFRQLRAGLRLAPKDPEMYFKAALIYDHFGDKTQALYWLRHALAAHYSPSTVRDTPFFDNLRSDPRFPALLQAPGT